jgi:hypothetical protein
MNHRQCTSSIYEHEFHLVNSTPRKIKQSFSTARMGIFIATK